MAKIGRYVVTGELGRGRTGVVHITLDPVIGRQVAVKVVDKAGDPAGRDERVAQLRREVQTGGTLHHTNIAATYEHGEDDAIAWSAMEMVQGQSLRAHLDSGYRATLEPLSDLVVQLLEGVDYAHRRGVTHGDLRAEKALIDQNGALKLIGFRGRGDEQTDIAGAKVVLKELFDSPPPLLDDSYPSARAILEALRALAAPKALSEKARALRRAVKDATIPPLLPGRRLPAVLFVD